jgi:hypothetical protein
MHALAKAVDEDRIMQAYRRRNRIILFDDVDINTQIEVEVSGQKIVQALLVRAANRKSVEQLSREIRSGQRGDASVSDVIGGRWHFSAVQAQSVPCCGER